MNISSSINRAVDIAGSQSELARLLGLRPQAVQQWVETGALPSTRVLAVAKAIDWQVTPHELAPDIYPHPEDGLPVNLRGSKRVKGKAA